MHTRSKMCRSYFLLSALDGFKYFSKLFNVKQSKWINNGRTMPNPNAPQRASSFAPWRLSLRSSGVYQYKAELEEYQVEVTRLLGIRRLLLP